MEKWSIPQGNAISFRLNLDQKIKFPYHHGNLKTTSFPYAYKLAQMETNVSDLNGSI